MKKVAVTIIQMTGIVWSRRWKTNRIMGWLGPSSGALRRPAGRRRWSRAPVRRDRAARRGGVLARRHSYRAASMRRPRHHRVAPRLELAAGLPLRPRVGPGDPEPHPEEQVRILRRASEVPPRFDLVRHLVIVVGHVLVAAHPPVVGGHPDDVEPRVGVER